MKATDQIKHAAFEKTLDYLLEDPERNATKIMDMLDKVAPADLFPSQRTAFRNAIDQQSNWHQLITRVLELNPAMRNDFIKTFLVDGNLMAWPKQETMREKHRCNVPWAILMDPTSACNLHCTGCWAAEYGHQENLSYDELDSIIRQGTELGTYVYIYTGGEPLVRKRDLIALCETHPDCSFLSFTNATLIDEEILPRFAAREELHSRHQRGRLRGSNRWTPRRGHVPKVVRAMRLLKQHGLPLRRLVLLHVSQRRFHRLRGVLRLDDRPGRPIRLDIHLHARRRGRARRTHGASRPARTPLPLRPRDAQQETAVHPRLPKRWRVRGRMHRRRTTLFAYQRRRRRGAVRVRALRQREHTRDDVARCPEISDLHAVLRAAAVQRQLAAPCPILENRDVLADMVETAGAHSTDLQAKESARDLCAKCTRSIEEWEPVAERIWTNAADPLFDKPSRSRPRHGRNR